MSSFQFLTRFLWSAALLVTIPNDTSATAFIPRVVVLNGRGTSSSSNNLRQSAGHKSRSSILWDFSSPKNSSEYGSASAFAPIKTEGVEQHVRTYDIPGHANGGRLVYYGNTNAKQIVFFCGGWPDDCSVFAPLAQRLATANNDLLCGVTCLPGYDDTDKVKFRSSAFTTDEVIASLQEACHVLRTQVSTNTNNATVTGIFHDWGCVFGAMLVSRLRKRYFESLVYFDILPPCHKSAKVQKKLNIRQSIVFTAYTSLFAVAHAIQRFLSYYIALPFSILGVGILNMFGLLPTGKTDAATFRQVQQPNLSLRKIMYMQYPYFNLYRALLTRNMRSMAGFHLPRSVEKTPVLFMYGTEKNINFHDDNELEWLRQQSASMATTKTIRSKQSKAIAVPEAGHWLYLQQPNVCYQAVQSFLAQPS